MTAKEMFKQLGYKCINKNKKWACYRKTAKPLGDVDNIMIFSFGDIEVSSSNSGVFFPTMLRTPVLEAINKQREEFKKEYERRKNV